MILEFPIRSALFYARNTVTYIVLNIPILKILSVTCNNASVNNAMMNELDSMLAYFEGEETRMCCILHIANLVTKTLIKQFNVPETQEGKDLTVEEEELQAIAERLDVEESKMMDMIGTDLGKDDHIDGWIDEISLMSAQEKGNLE